MRKETPAEVYRCPTSQEVPWQLRIVPNRFPAVATQLLSDSPAYGQHEVLIESACHEDDWLSISIEHLAHVFQAIAARLRHWSTDPHSQYIQVFKNVGSRAWGDPDIRICNWYR